MIPLTQQSLPSVKLQWRLAALKNGFRDAVAYPWEFAFEILGSMVVPAAIQWVFWYAIFSLGGASAINGMTHTDLLHYTWVSILFTQVRGGDHDFEIQEMIRTGSLSNYLLRPIGFLEFIYLRGGASRLFLSFICLLIGLITLPLLGHDPSRILPAMFLAILGNIIHFQIGAVLATSAFYWEEAHSILMVKNMVVSFLSGELLPLSLFPLAMKPLWELTPFYLYVFGPTQYALGKWSHQQLMDGISAACLWILGLRLLIWVSWKIGMRKYLSLGG